MHPPNTAFIQPSDHLQITYFLHLPLIPQTSCFYLSCKSLGFDVTEINGKTLVLVLPDFLTPLGSCLPLPFTKN